MPCIFSNSYTCSNVVKDDDVESEYMSRRTDYCGLPFTDDYLIDTELVSSTISNLRAGKAAGLDTLTVEH